MSKRFTFMNHQAEVYRWSKRKKTPAFFLKMRLGKTLIAQRWADRRHNANRILVVSPKSVVRSWKRELRRDGHDPITLLGTTKQKEQALEENQDSRWFLTNPEALTIKGKTAGRSASRIAKLPWDCVLWDESTTIRSPKAKVTKVGVDYLGQAPYKAILSGLPNPEGPEDYVTQMMFLLGEFMGHDSFWTWRQEFMLPIGHSWGLKRGVHGQIEDEVREHAYIMSLKDAGLGNKRIFERRYIELPANVMRDLAEAERNFECRGKLTNTKLATFTWMQQLTGGFFDDKPIHYAKAIELKKLVIGELRGCNMVVWCKYTNEIRMVCEALGPIAKPCHAGVDVNRAVYRFQEGRTQILVAQPKILKMGVDLSIASTAVYYSSYWDYEILAQTIERLEHPLKHFPLLYIYLIAENTIDEDIDESLIEKGVGASLLFRNFMNRRRAA